MGRNSKQDLVIIVSLQVYGVVVWAKEHSSTAIVWCSDGNRLAYIEKDVTEKDGVCWPSTGDLVLMTIREEGKLRYCDKVRLVERNYNPDVARLIRKIKGNHQAASQTNFDSNPLTDYQKKSVDKALLASANTNGSPRPLSTKPRLGKALRRPFARLRLGQEGA
ncbi:hypothetical protein COL8621_01949 [Actibacterium lipolyticum]|uniref:Uncharacterized protein n=1 Tax=Actibacterium lipolyticum TaxID=1524263 RepID=A0A238KI69_9RHOB|nr:hypothetical protein COL8621_01949 [Actibacterium lipolyticum]